MSIQLQTNSISKSIYNHLNDYQISTSVNESWVRSQSELKLCFQTSKFFLIAQHIECRNNKLAFLGAFSYHNGIYEEVFLKLANKNGHNICFFVQGDRKQLLLKCSLSFTQNISVEQKLNKCFLTLKTSIPILENTLQIIGMGIQHNKLSYKIKKTQLQIKHNTIDTLIKNQINKQIDGIKEIKKQNSCLIPIKYIVQNPQQIINEMPIKKGGYFQVQRKNSIITRETGQTEKKDIAWKTPVNPEHICEVSEAKIKKQVQLVQKVFNSKYLVTYYLNKNQPYSIYMDYIPSLLKDLIYQQEISCEKLINLAQQIVEAIAILHKSKIVHRDLKPDNVLVDGQTIKIIDFAESSLTDQQFGGRNFLGSTIPYSPIQCILGKEEGFNKTQIDLWSIPMLLYEMAFKSLPIFYNRWIGPDILQKWRTTNDFSIFPIYRKRRGLMNIQTILSIITNRGLQIKPQQRLGLCTYHQLLSQIKQFHQTIINIL